MQNPGVKPEAIYADLGCRCLHKGSEGDELLYAARAAGYTPLTDAHDRQMGLGILLCLLQAARLLALLAKLAKIFGLNRLQNSD